MIVCDLSNSFHPCPKPAKTTKKAQKRIQQKSKKLASLERKRFSITENHEKCFFCENKKEDFHEAFRGRNRQKSMKWGLVIPICYKCHRKITDNKEFSVVLEQLARNTFIKKYGQEKFIEEFK